MHIMSSCVHDEKRTTKSTEGYQICTQTNAEAYFRHKDQEAESKD